jgi:hypothetical protein
MKDGTAVFTSSEKGRWRHRMRLAAESHNSGVVSLLDECLCEEERKTGGGFVLEWRWPRLGCPFYSGGGREVADQGWVVGGGEWSFNDFKASILGWEMRG